LDEEKAGMALVFQRSTVQLNVGGHRFETSLETLTSVPDSFFAAMFSGRFALAPGADGSYFIDRDGTHFRHILNFLRDAGGTFKLSSDMTEAAVRELAAEVEFYGLVALLSACRPHWALEKIGKALLERACELDLLTGDKMQSLQTAVVQARSLIFMMGSTTPFLSPGFQDLRWTITDRVVNGSPVWAAEGGEYFMYRSFTGRMTINLEGACAAGNDSAVMQNLMVSFPVMAPTEVPKTRWASNACTTCASEFASSSACPGGTTLNGRKLWVQVPRMRFTPMHGLDDDHPAMAAALQQLAALSDDESIIY
jgi:hypothetical protein